MPEVLRQWFSSLDPRSSDYVLIYLEDNPTAVEEMTATLRQQGTSSVSARKAWETIRARYTPDQITARASRAGLKAWETIRAKRAAALAASNPLPARTGEAE